MVVIGSPHNSRNSRERTMPERLLYHENREKMASWWLGNLCVEKGIYSYGSLNIVKLKNIGLILAAMLGEMTSGIFGNKLKNFR